MLGATPDQILEVASDVGLQGVEWSTDGYLDVGDLEQANSLMLKTLRARLSIASYATLFRAGFHDESEFSRVLSTARALQAPLIRVWSAPKSKSAGKDRSRFLDAARTLGDRAAKMGTTICFGLAAGTVLDTYGRAAKLFSALDHPFVKLAWEPVPALVFDEVMKTFTGISGQVGFMVAPFVSPNAHSRPLCETEEDWISYIDAFDEQGGNTDMARYVLFRAVNGDSRERLEKDVGMIKHYSRQLRMYRRRRIL